MHPILAAKGLADYLCANRDFGGALIASYDGQLIREQKTLAVGYLFRRLFQDKVVLRFVQDVDYCSHVSSAWSISSLFAYRTSVRAFSFALFIQSALMKRSALSNVKFCFL